MGENIFYEDNMSARQDLEELFLRKKPIRLLLNIKIGGNPKYVSILAKETDCTYSHTVKLLDIFKALGIVEFEKQGRIKYVRLTQDGADLVGDFESVLRKFAKLKPKKPIIK
ncbi:MAG: hypothetical protein NT120_00640 [Candidatus Aenigmarchaeota archaeon]|nr:hypothetical protein [Candidatus Aenigmarchaeota archaeon]